MDNVGASLMPRNCADLQVDAFAIRTDVQRHAIPDFEDQDVMSENVQNPGSGNAVATSGPGEENVHSCIPYIMDDTNSEDKGDHPDDLPFCPSAMGLGGCVTTSRTLAEIECWWSRLLPSRRAWTDSKAFTLNGVPGFEDASAVTHVHSGIDSPQQTRQPELDRGRTEPKWRTVLPLLDARDQKDQFAPMSRR